jgi:hypothetical protein
MPSSNIVSMRNDSIPLSKLSKNGIIICWEGYDLAHKSSWFNFLEHTNENIGATTHKMGILHSMISFSNKLQEGYHQPNSWYTKSPSNLCTLNPQHPGSFIWSLEATLLFEYIF